MAEGKFLNAPIHESSEADKKKHVVTGIFRGNNKLREDQRRLEAYGVGPHISSRRAMAMIGGVIASKIGLAPHFNFDSEHHVSSLAWRRFDLSLKKAPVAAAMYEELGNEKSMAA